MTHTRVGTAVCVCREGKVLLGLRKSQLANGTWAFPGGHLEFKELVVDSVIRETLEETGIAVKNIRFWTFTEDFYSDKHYITLTYLADWDSGEPEVKEPEKCAEWRWFEWDELSRLPLMPPIQTMLDKGFRPETVV